MKQNILTKKQRKNYLNKIINNLHPVYSSNETVYFMANKKGMMTIEKQDFLNKLKIKISKSFNSVYLDKSTEIKKGDYFLFNNHKSFVPIGVFQRIEFDYFGSANGLSKVRSTVVYKKFKNNNLNHSCEIYSNKKLKKQEKMDFDSIIIEYARML
ncbi:MAG: hypothetical protein PHV16_03990 [Candidatus Nanoarchaeia archaeon]|nr:hypothetical protein [Candidatus Nanoarchaeia archaeon]